MLVLSRKVGERIVLPETGVSISVLAIRGKRVRIGIEAPPTASVHREEVWCRIADSAGRAGSAEPVSEAMRTSHDLDEGDPTAHEAWLGDAGVSPLEGI